MSYFASAAEVDHYVGALFRLAAEDPCLGPQLACASVRLCVACTDLSARLTLELSDPVRVVWAEDPDDGLAPDVELSCASDFLDGFLRGDRDLVEALARGEVHVKGRVSKALKVLPVLEQAFPFYRQLVAAKDGGTSAYRGVIP